jgi:UV excision repair protein RAD23
VNNTTLSTQEFNDSVQNIVDMGFPRNDAVRALNAAYGDSARAVEYIVGGNIPNINNEARAANPPPPAVASGAPGGAGGVAAPQGNPNSPFAQLRQLPQFQGIIALIQQNPAFLEPLLQQLAERDPAIVELIRDNREEFLQILQQPVDPNILNVLQAQAEEDGEDYGDEDDGDMQGVEPTLGGGRPAGVPPGATVIHITPQEKEAVDRLVALGFDRNRALEAFLVCNKDEEMAANYLFEQGE